MRGEPRVNDVIRARNHRGRPRRIIAVHDYHVDTVGIDTDRWTRISRRRLGCYEVLERGAGTTCPHCGAIA